MPLHYKVECLAQYTRNQPFLLKTETNTRPLHCLLAPSAKQHLIMMAPKSKYPRLSGRPYLLCKKIKGISRNRHSNITYLDFVDVAVKNRLAKKVTTGRFQRDNFNMFVIQSDKKCLSNLSTKRVYDKRYKTSTSFFSFPLNWRSRYAK